MDHVIECRVVGWLAAVVFHGFFHFLRASDGIASQIRTRSLSATSSSSSLFIATLLSVDIVSVITFAGKIKIC